MVIITNPKQKRAVKNHLGNFLVLNQSSPGHCHHSVGSPLHSILIHTNMGFLNHIRHHQRIRGNASELCLFPEHPLHSHGL